MVYPGVKGRGSAGRRIQGRTFSRVRCFFPRGAGGVCCWWSGQGLGGVRSGGERSGYRVGRLAALRAAAGCRGEGAAGGFLVYPGVRGGEGMGARIKEVSAGG